MDFLGLAALGGAGALLLRRKKNPVTHGSARWLRLGEAARRNLFHPSGFLLGDWKRWLNLPVYYKGSSNILTCAPPGSGKGAMSLVPNALRESHLFLIDPGGETTAVACKSWRRKRMTFFCVNPWGMHTGDPWLLPVHGFNPLMLIDPKSRSFASDCGWLAAMLITRTGKESEPHWQDKAENGLKCLIMFSRVQHAPNLVTVRRLITGTHAQWDSLIRAMQNSGDEAVRNQGNEWRRMTGDDGKKENKEWSSIISGMERATAWIEDDEVRACLESHDVDFEALKQKKGAVISFIMPLEYAQSHAAFSRVAIACVLLTMARRPLAKSRVRMMLDEYGALGHVKMVNQALVTMRKYKLSIQLVIHMLEQIKTNGSFAEIEGACEVRQYIAAWDHETADHASLQSGESTVETTSVSGNRITRGYTHRRLIKPEEVQQIHYEKQLVFIGNSRPVLMRCRPYWERPLLRGSYHENPFFRGQKKGMKVYWPVELLAGGVFRAASWVLGPSKTVIALAAGLALAGAFHAGVRVEQRGQYCAYQTVTGLEWWNRCGLVKFNGGFYGF